MKKKIKKNDIVMWVKGSRVMIFRRRNGDSYEIDNSTDGKFTVPAHEVRPVTKQELAQLEVQWP